MSQSDEPHSISQSPPGGPLILPGSSPDQDVLIGIVSWGFECDDSSLPQVFSRVSEAFAWISTNICTGSTAPPEYLCNGILETPEPSAKSTKKPTEQPTNGPAMTQTLEPSVKSTENPMLNQTGVPTGLSSLATVTLSPSKPFSINVPSNLPSLSIAPTLSEESLQNTNEYGNGVVVSIEDLIEEEDKDFIVFPTSSPHEILTKVSAASNEVSACTVLIIDQIPTIIISVSMLLLRYILE